LNSEQGVRAAFYVSWDAASFSSLREYARQIDLLFPTWLQVLERTAICKPRTGNEHDVRRSSGQKARPVDAKVMTFLKAEDTEMEVYPVVQNFDGTDFVPGVVDFLNNPEARAKFRREIGIFLASDHYRGLMVDFESFPKKGQAVTSIFERTRGGFARQGNEALRQRAGAQRGFRLQSHFRGSGWRRHHELRRALSRRNARPVASQDWFTSNLESAIKEIPKEKLICAIGNYGYDWVEKPKKGKLPPGLADKSVSVQEAWIGARDRKKMSILMATRSTRTSVTRTTITSATMSGFWMR